MFDTVNMAMRQACESFGGEVDGLFNAAGFGQALARIAGVSSPIDGKVVEAILCGRHDVVQLSGGAHYKMIEILGKPTRFEVSDKEMREQVASL